MINVPMLPESLYRHSGASGFPRNELASLDVLPQTAKEPAAVYTVYKNNTPLPRIIACVPDAINVWITFDAALGRFVHQNLHVFSFHTEEAATIETVVTIIDGLKNLIEVNENGHINIEVEPTQTDGDEYGGYEVEFKQGKSSEASALELDCLLDTCARSFSHSLKKSFQQTHAVITQVSKYMTNVEKQTG